MVDGQDVSFKDTTREMVENSNKIQVADKKVKNEKSNDCENNAAKSPVLQIRGSKIPRAKVVVLPVHTIQECHPVLLLRKYG